MHFQRDVDAFVKFFVLCAVSAYLDADVGLAHAIVKLYVCDYKT
jgi:hypothetical protein